MTDNDTSVRRAIVWGSTGVSSQIISDETIIDENGEEVRRIAFRDREVVYRDGLPIGITLDEQGTVLINGRGIGRVEQTVNDLIPALARMMGITEEEVRQRLFPDLSGDEPMLGNQEGNHD